MITVEHMEKMDFDSLVIYLNDQKLTKESILSLLESEEIPYKKYHSNKKLVECFAREVSMRGIYKRIARNHSK